MTLSPEEIATSHARDRAWYRSRKIGAIVAVVGFLAGFIIVIGVFG